MPILIVYLIIAVALVALLMSDKTRKPALAVIVVLSISGVIYYEYTVIKRQKTEQLIAAKEISLQDVKIKKVKDSEYELTGRIYNKSKQYKLHELELKFQLRDCQKDQPIKQCTIVGEIEKRFSMDVPPQQARDFKDTLYTPGIVVLPKGKIVWDYAIKQTRAVKK